MSSDFEERFNELTHNKNVIGAMILTAEGKTVRTTFDTSTSSNYSEFAYKLLKSTRELLQVKNIQILKNFFETEEDLRLPQRTNREQKKTSKLSHCH